jgi:RNA polymerase sigma factor (sigma-70 family)
VPNLRERMRQVALSGSFDTTLAAARAGEDWAWATIYRELAPAVLGYLRAHGAPEADDLTGQVFLDVVRGLPRFRGDERDFRAWVFTVAHHDLLDERRRRARKPAQPMPPEQLTEVGPHGDSEEEAVRGLNAERVRRILDRLSPAQRDVLSLRIFGDLTIEQVARVVRKRPGAVKALQRRGLAAVLRELQREGVPF